MASGQRRRQIVNAARTLITTHGIAALTIQDLADAVNLSEGALYRHFKSKDDILLLLIEDVSDGLTGILDRTDALADTPLKKLEALFLEHLAYAEKREGISFVLIAESMSLAEHELRQAVQDLLHRYIHRVAQIVGEAVAAGQARAVDPNATAVMFFGMIQAIVTLWSSSGRQAPLAERAPAMWDVFRNGVASDSLAIDPAR